MRVWLSKPATQKDGNGAGWLEADKVMAAVTAGEVKQAAVDDAVRRMLRVMFTAGLFDHPHMAGGEVDTPDQQAVARAAATEGMVLLKNANGALPLDAKQIHSLAVIGPNAAVARNGGGGSSLVRSKYAVTPLAGIEERAAPQVKVQYALGVAMEGADAGDAAARQAALDEAVALARRSEAAVVVVGYAPQLESEGFDRKSMDLPAGQGELIEAVAAANPRTIVVVVAGAPVTMKGWIDRVPGVLYAWYGGQEAGHAIGDLLFGAANPSGKLPVTFPKDWKDSPAYGHYPGENLHVAYAEGIYVGYRGFDQRNVDPLFPFGHGLSYTTFEYSDLAVTPARVERDKPVTVTMKVRNTGPRAGAEVVQLYVHQVHSSEDRPPKELKAFRRVTLGAGESQTVKLTLGADAMSFYSEARKDWVAEPGRFEVMVGASSRDIRLRGKFELGR
jgi:beta-glucosidase